MEEQLVKALNLAEGPCPTRVSRLTKKGGEILANRMWKRKANELPTFGHFGEDPVGDLRDRMLRDRQGAIEEILQTGYLGFLNEMLSVEGKVLYLDLIPGSLTVFDKGTVFHSSEGLSKSLRDLLIEISKDARSKEALITQVWGYKYHPLRHDALVYSAIAKLRRLLGDSSSWLSVSEVGYGLLPDVRLISNAVTVCNVKESVPVESGVTLNIRQQKLLQYFGKEAFIDTPKYKELFTVSDVTAVRDLGELVRLGLVEKIGRARATKYQRKEVEP